MQTFTIGLGHRRLATTKGPNLPARNIDSLQPCETLTVAFDYAASRSRL